MCKESLSPIIFEQSTTGQHLSPFNEYKSEINNASHKIATQSVISTAMNTNTTTTPTNNPYPNTSTGMNNDRMHQAPPKSLFNFSSPFPDIKIQFPVFVTSLYKSGTTSVHSYFLCGKQRSIHHQHGKRYRLGFCLMQNMKVSKNDNETTKYSRPYFSYSNAYHVNTVHG
jgi:hypothetical protein